MSNKRYWLYLAPDDRGIVVFMLWPSLPYNLRFILSIAFVFVGLGTQFTMGSFFPGCLSLIVGNLFLLVKGYDNRVDFGRYVPSAHWETIEKRKLQELQELERKAKKWDLSALDVTNVGGGLVFITVVASLVIIYSAGHLQVLVLDAMILLLPHWITGIRSILRKPGLIVKVKTIEKLLNTMEPALKHHEVDLMVLLKGDERKIPDDVKFKVDIRGHDKDFLGLYGQVVINTVQGSSYPYFYVVLVARQSYGLNELFRNYQPPSNVRKEFKIQEKVEVLVIRQTTTKTSGYHTPNSAMHRIFREGLLLAEKVAVQAQTGFF